MDTPRFVIEASEAESMTKASGVTVTQLLPLLVKPSQCLARPPISNYPVVAVGVGSSGRIFFGVNLEFPGLPLHHSVHAEQFLVTNLCLHGETNLDFLVTSAAPCGHCRQFLQEIRGAQDIKLLITSDDDDKFKPLSEYLIHRFGPGDLLDKEVPLLLEPHHNGLKFMAESLMIPDDADNNVASKIGDKLKFAALDAANNSHAPYSNCPSGMALLDCDGKIFRGSYMESAAYNPSFGPVQAALVAYVASGGGSYDRIVAAVLVEKKVAVVKQEQTARILLYSISPCCEFVTFHCHAGDLDSDDAIKA